RVAVRRRARIGGRGRRIDAATYQGHRVHLVHDARAGSGGVTPRRGGEGQALPQLHRAPEGLSPWRRQAWREGQGEWQVPARPVRDQLQEVARAVQREQGQGPRPRRRRLREEVTVAPPGAADGSTIPPGANTSSWPP